MSIYNQGSPYAYQDTVSAYQQRLNSMAQQFAGQGQQNPFPQMNPMGMGQGQFQQTIGTSFNVRAVTGYEEAVASQIPLDGSISVFTDFSHGNIYTKQLNMRDGTALMRTYKLTENPSPMASPVENSVEYVKKTEFEELKSKFNEVWEALTAQPSTSEKSNSTKKENAK